MSGARREWSDDEVSKLRHLAREELGVDAIAKTLGHSTASVRAKAFWLDLSFEANVAIGLKKGK